MLQFIVLGEIPGTHLQITFAWYAIFLLAGLIWLDVKIHKSHSSTKKPRAKRVEVIRPSQV